MTDAALSPPRQRGPARPRPSPPASRILTVRVPEALGAALDARAEAVGLTAGAVVRAALAGAVGAGEGLAVPVRRYHAPRPAPSLEVVRLAELREALGEANGTLRQVAGLDRGRGGARLPELDAAIDKVLYAIAAVDGWKAVREAAVLEES